MKDTLLKIAEYIEEQNSRIQVLERKVEVIEKSNDELKNEIALLKSRIEELESHPMMDDETPEVEVELIMDEDEEAVAEEKDIPETIADSETAQESDPIAESVPATEPAPEPEPLAAPAKEPESSSAPAEEKKPQKPVQTSLFSTPVTDIRQAISLGDRFLFQRELFGGNGEDMQKTLTNLNDCADMNEALSVLEPMGWDKGNSTYELFMNVLRRRFS